MLHEKVAGSLTDVDHVTQGSHSCQNMRRDFFFFLFSGGHYLNVFTREARPSICFDSFMDSTNRHRRTVCEKYFLCDMRGETDKAYK